MPSRRQFIQVGLAGAALLATARWLDRSEASPAPGQRLLDERAAAIVGGLVPVILAGVLPEEEKARARAIREVSEAFDRAVAGLSPAVQREVDQLFSILRLAPVRFAFTGLWSPVEESSAEEIAAFLQRWRTSRFDIQRAGYQAMTQLVQASWYDNPQSWAQIGYPGPPAVPGRR